MGRRAQPVLGRRKDNPDGTRKDGWKDRSEHSPPETPPSLVDTPSSSPEASISPSTPNYEPYIPPGTPPSPLTTPPPIPLPVTPTSPATRSTALPIAHPLGLRHREISSLEHSLAEFNGHRRLPAGSQEGDIVTHEEASSTNGSGGEIPASRTAARQPDSPSRFTTAETTSTVNSRRILPSVPLHNDFSALRYFRWRLEEAHITLTSDEVASPDGLSQGSPSFIPRALGEFYLLLLFRLPLIYLSSASSLITAWKTLDEQNGGSAERPNGIVLGTVRQDHSGVSVESRQSNLEKFQVLWEVFLEEHLEEWRLCMKVSALVLAAVFATFQIPGTASNSAVSATAQLSIFCVLPSVIYAWLMLNHFGTCKGRDKGFAWIQDAQVTNRHDFWNYWVLLSMPVVWVRWGTICFVISLLLHVWTAQSTTKPDEIATSLYSKILVTIVFSLALWYLGLMWMTLRRYNRIRVGQLV